MIVTSHIQIGQLPIRTVGIYSQVEQFDLNSDPFGFFP